MRLDEPEPLWREVVGDTEPWRRGRMFLVGLAIWSLLTQALLIGSQLLAGRVEVMLGAAVGALISWLLFYFIWIGVHWVRWVCAAFSGLVGFANVIWGLVYSNPVRLIDGVIGLPLAAYLGLAPSVYFFALRQKETVRWKESLVVGAVFALLLVSFGTAVVTLGIYKAHLEAGAHDFAHRAFRRVFVEGDGDFLVKHATARLIAQEGAERLAWFADPSMHVGALREMKRTRGRLRFWFQPPARLGSEGRMSTYAMSKGGPVRLDLIIGEAGGEWQIDALQWRFIDPATMPSD